MASLLLKLGKGNLELAATDALLHAFPCKVIFLGPDGNVLFWSTPVQFLHCN